MSDFLYERPTSVAEATALLAGAAGAARVLAGGTDLVVALRAGTARPRLVVDVKRIAELAEISWTGDGDLVLGACVTVGRIGEDRRIRAAFPALAEGAATIGSLQVRSRATVGGNLANASPCMDTAPPLLVLGAELAIAGPGSERRLPLVDFFTGVKQTVLGPAEIVTAVRVPGPGPGARSGFDKITRVFGHDLALVNAAAAFDPGSSQVRVAIGSCGITPLLVPALEGVDQSADPVEIGERLASRALERICPIDDVRASAEYRRDMAVVLCRRLAMRLFPGPGRAS
jgi:CO/xanthine dehydrogenase FAD-binding subunit